jgi:uncharacterized delta-60 repeat protein
MKKTLLFLIALVTMATQAQSPGDIAQSYGAIPAGFNNRVNTILVQSDGKILVGGGFTTYNGITENNIIRLNSDGTKDTSFNTGTGYNGSISPYYGSISTIVQQADGKILVGGGFTTYNGVTENRIIRLNSDGSKDTTFNTGTGFNNNVTSIKLQADGKILVGGYFTTYNGVTENKIIRLNSNGNKDTTFNTGTGILGFVFSIEVQTNGKILIGGFFTDYDGVIEHNIIRLNTNGSKDTAFNTGTGFGAWVNTIKQQADGKILLGGEFGSYNGNTENYIIRLNSSGTKDTSFDTDTGFNNTVYSIAVQTDGKILVGGNFTSYKGVAANRIIRLNASGSKNTSFAIGTGFNFTVDTIAVQADGKILVGGTFSTYNGVTENKIIRINTDGTKDATFNNGQFDNIIRTTEEQTDGKILIGGLFTSFKGSTENRIIRLNTDSTKDTSFNTGTGFDGTVYIIKKQTDGKIIVGGNFTTYKGVAQNYLIRLNTDGTKDASFDIGTGFDASVRTVKILDNGKILVGGTFTNYQGVTTNRLILLNADGTKDTSFNTGTGFNNDVYTLVQQTDGKFLVGGLFTTFNGTTVNRMVRLNTNGTLDTTFTTGTAFSSTVLTIELQTDGKILVGGFFANFNGGAVNRIVRLNTDGTLDTSFNTGTGFDDAVRTIKLQTDGKIVVGGVFTTYNGVNANKIITLNTDGTKDAAFINGTGFNSDVYSINQLADGKILVGGNFTTYKGDNSSAYLIKLHTEQSLSTTSFDAANAFVIYPNPAKDVLHLKSNNFTTIKGVKIYDLQGKVVLQDTNDTINVSNLAKGLYIVKIVTEEGEVTKKFIKE